MIARARIVVAINRVRYVLIMPCCALVVSLTIGVCWLAMPFGPDFSYHDKSIRWVAMSWPHFRLAFGSRRCVVEG